MKRALRFLHRDRHAVVAPPAPVSRDIGVLGVDSRIKGDLKFQGTLTVDGAVLGDIHAPEGSGAMLIIGENASVAGDIVSDSVLISGRVTGNVKAGDRVEIFGTGVLHGDIATGDVMIQGGAEFQGRCQMTKVAPPLPHPGDDSPVAPGHVPAAGMSSTLSHDAARTGRKPKGARSERLDSHAARADGTSEIPQGVAVPQDSRREGGGSTEGSSA